MAPEVRSSQSSAAFDFNSHAGVTHILHAIRQSDCSNDTKSDLRDLVFLFTNSGGDAAVRNSLEKQLAAHNIQFTAPTTSQDTATETPPTPTVHHGFATGRRAPQKFATAPTATSAATPVTAPNANPPVTTIKPTIRSVSDATSVTSDARPVTPAATKSERDQTTPVERTASTNTQSVAPAQSQPTVTPAQPSDIKEQASATTAARPTPAAPAAADTTAAGVQSAPDTVALERIKHIKGDVNKTFGNPVNLVDINKEVGREYMSALLEAMKILSSGSPIAIKDAMERLETVYAQIQAIDVASDSTGQATQTAPAQAPADTAPATNTQSAPQTPVTPSVTPDTHLPEQKPAAAVPTQPAATAAESAQSTPATTRVVPSVPSVAAQARAQTEAPVGQAAVSSVNNTANDSTSVPTNVAPQPTFAPTSQAAPMSPVTPDSPASSSGEQSATAKRTDVAVPGAASAGVAARSVADEPPLHTPNDLPDPKEVANASVNGDPLYTPQIDAGLEQLLREWPLFNKSGLFGTGPKGREHPLFLKLADLQIPLILAGRFEGANPTIKQSVTDYMNGWRYEQGILYAKGETFEQYLRRVIKHIIDWQEQKRSS